MLYKYCSVRETSLCYSFRIVAIIVDSDDLRPFFVVEIPLAVSERPFQESIDLSRQVSVDSR